MNRRIKAVQSTGIEGNFNSRFLLKSTVLILLLFSGSCSVFATRPVQDMSDTEAALRAAKEVQADTLAPELYRQANEWWFNARKEYRFKNFALAQEEAVKARRFAEQAEFEALRNGGNRTDVAPVDQAIQAPSTQSIPSGGGATPEPSSTPYAYPTPQGTPADQYEQRKTEDEARKAREAQANQPAAPQATETPPVVLSPPTFAVPGK
jgi:hypothetical protein